MFKILLATAVLIGVTAGDALATPDVTNDFYVEPDPVFDAKIGNLKLGEILYGLSCGHIEQEQQIKELERKVAGMQKQITILHAKKVDKKGAK